MCNNSPESENFKSTSFFHPLELTGNISVTVIKPKVFFSKTKIELTTNKVNHFLYRLMLEMRRICTLSAKDRGATKNPAVDLEIILMQDSCV